MRRGLLGLSALAVAIALAVPMNAFGWVDDFFDGAASGQAVFEDMAVHPQAVRVGSTIYTVYQGDGLDPWIIAFDDSGAIRGPYKVGENPLAGGADPDDSHGAPSLLYDPVSKNLHVFWGAHASVLRHARTTVPGNITKWTTYPAMIGRVTYPQVFRDDAGVAHLFFRRDDNSGAMDGTRTVYDRQGWWHITSLDGGETWTRPVAVITGKVDISWYAHFEMGANGTVHMAAVTHQRNDPSPLGRSGVYYARLEIATGLWRDAAGSVLATAGGSIPADARLSTSTVFALPAAEGECRNGVTIADDGTGEPVVGYVAGGESGPDACRWETARYDGSAWTTSTITTTDFLMDSGVLDYGTDGALDAFLTVGAGLAGPSSDPYSYRGGDLERWRSVDDGTTWTKVSTLKKADPSNGIVYNDPQTVAGYAGTGPRVLFGEWDNDAGNFVHKVFLWGPDGFRGKEFFPTVKRLAGADRYEAASAISREGFENGADTVVVASGEVHADALAGAPLAQAYHAPLLLVRKGAVPPSIRTEIARLKARQVIVLGGAGTVTTATAQALKVGSVTAVRRIAGADRYAVASAIASELAQVAGPPGGAFVVSGTAWADALSAASVAAARGWPVLLVKGSQVPAATSGALASLGVTRTIVVGGPATVPNSVLALLPGAVRISGADRYAVSATMAEYALDGGPALPQTLRTDRILVASGQVFPDALAGSVLAARSRGPLLLTKGSSLSAPTSSFLRRRAYRVLECYVLGGTGTVAPVVAGAVADALRERQAK